MYNFLNAGDYCAFGKFGRGCAFYITACHSNVCCAAAEQISLPYWKGFMNGAFAIPTNTSSLRYLLFWLIITLTCVPNVTTGCWPCASLPPPFTPCQWFPNYSCTIDHDPHFFPIPTPSLTFLFFPTRAWWEKSTAASGCRGRWTQRSSRWSWMQLWRRDWTHTSWKSGTAGTKTLYHPHTTSNPKPKCLRTTRTLWVQLNNQISLFH